MLNDLQIIIELNTAFSRIWFHDLWKFERFQFTINADHYTIKKESVLENEKANLTCCYLTSTFEP